MDFFQKILSDIRYEYEPKNFVRAMIVTGSVARGEAKPGNDIDVLLVTHGEKIKKEYRVEESLVELGSIVLPDAIFQMEKSPMYVYMYLDAKAIFDKENVLPKLQEKAQSILDGFRVPEEEKKALVKWLSSVVNKVTVAQRNGDPEKVGFHVSNVLWKTVEGLYMVNNLPTPASTSALRRIKSLTLLPENFDSHWHDAILGDLNKRASATLKLMSFVLKKL